MKGSKFNSFAYDVTATFKPDTIDGRCQAKFRLSPRYKDDIAPFGFDWVRTGDSSAYVAFDTPYKGNMGRYYTDSKKSVLPTNTREQFHFDAKPEMYNRLCKSYPPGNLMIFPIKNSKIQRYHVPVLSIYPYSRKHPVTAKLSLEIEIESDISAIQLEFNNSFFEITEDPVLSTGKGKHVHEISIKCIKEFAQDEYIHVMAINPKGKRKKAGMLRICKNAKQFRFQTKILLVNIKFAFSTDDTDLLFAGYVERGKKHMKDLLSHALVSPIFEELDMDLGYDSELEDRLYEYQGLTSLLVSEVYIDSNGKICIDSKLQHLSEYLTEKVQAIRDIRNYSAIIYFLGTGLISSTGDAMRELYGVTTGKYVLLKNMYNDSTASHELLHALGLRHSFDNTFIDNKPTPFTYRRYTTDNIMDYTHLKDVERTNLWEWQWNKIREACIPEGE